MRNRHTKWEKEILKQDTIINLFVSRALNPHIRFRNHKSTNSHMITLFAAAISIHAQKILELGMGSGNCTLALLQAAHFTDGTVESVDYQTDSYEGFRCPSKFRDRLLFHQSDALEFLRNLPSDKIYDLVFIDDDHTYDHVKQEIDLIEPHVTPHSIILMHDAMVKSVPNYNNSKEPQHCGVAKSLASLSRDKWEYFTMPICHGLTFLRKLV
ncbi:hypothetical protein LCGC14_1274500 [marine sediment metagenome]|uniref:Methyltransferase domain-containing protein n=1 Tax=marine sediment metagenome TaxID=412755 RepID=A0A0F9P082_9ZZZZ